ncbi:MAG: hypothetical protein AB1656_12975 [Candidatus Omnitrophota bacterium]
MYRFYESEHEQKRETYLLAVRNPWLVWRLQALRAGYVPPLLPGRIPPDMLRLPIARQEEYHIEPLIKHAKRMHLQESKFAKRIVTLIVIGFIILMGMTFTLALREGPSFQIGIIEKMLSERL